MLKLVSKKTESIEAGQKRSNFLGRFDYFWAPGGNMNQRHQNQRH